MNSPEQEWLDSLGLSSRRIYERNWAYFKEFTELDADSILESKKNDGNKIWKGKILQFKQWMQENKGLSQNSAKTATGVVRGFFSFFETPLIMTRAERQRLDKAGRSTKDYKFTKEDVAKMALVGNLSERYILLFGKSVGFRANDFVKFTYGDFRSLDLESEAPIYMGEFNTQKKGIPANPFIDADSLPIITAILRANVKKKDTERIVSIRGAELSVILQRIAEKAKINYGNSRIRFHCLRKWLITRLSATMSESQWKQIVGKRISEDAYVSTELLKTAYNNAMKDLTVMTNNGHGAKEELLKEAINQLEQENSTFKTRINLLQDNVASLTKSNESLESGVKEAIQYIDQTNKEAQRIIKEQDQAFQKLLFKQKQDFDQSLKEIREETNKLVTEKTEAFRDTLIKVEKQIEKLQ